MKTTKFASLLFFLISFSSLLNATALPEWQIVPNESTLTFTATQNGAPVSGQFKAFTGKIYVDPANYKESKIDIIVDISSLSSSMRI